MQRPAHRLGDLEATVSKQINEREPDRERDQPAQQHHQPHVHRLSFDEVRPSRRVPTIIPTSAARIKPSW